MACLVTSTIKYQFKKMLSNDLYLTYFVYSEYEKYYGLLFAIIGIALMVFYEFISLDSIG
jgi:hypothetical protein